MSQPTSVHGSTPLENQELERAEQPGKKRKRKTLACYDCRRRKLKCDRIYPACGRCVRAGHANQCHYETLPDQGQDGSSQSEEDCVARMFVPKPIVYQPPRQPTNEAASTPLSTLLRAGKFELLEERIARLEALSKPTTPNIGRAAATTSQVSPYTPPRTALAHVEPPRDQQQHSEIEMIFFKGRSFHTQFYGATTPTSMISQFPELRTFMKAAIRQYSSLARIQSDLRTLNVQLKTEPPTYTQPLAASMLALIPERSVADLLVHLYFQNLESLYRVLHIPTFYTEYAHFWESPQDARPCFVAILLLVMASMTGLASNGPKTFIGRSSQTRETSVRWIQTVEDWMETQSRKNVSIENYQIWLLVVVSKHMNIIKKKRNWEAAGNIIRIFMCAGMHREPSILGRKMTFYDQEMRRRLWATAVEWDLQASLARGMASSVAACPSDCAAPANLDDKSFDETTVHSPRPQPSDEPTDTSFLHHASNSLRVRMSLASLVNDPGAHVEYDEVLRWEERIKRQLEAISNWDETESRNLLARVLLDVQLRQYLIWLHFPYASRTSAESQNNYSRAACFNNACTIIDLHSKVMERENYALCLLRNDGYLASLTICHNVFASSLHRSMLLLSIFIHALTAPDNVMFQSLTTSFAPSI